MPRLLLAQFVMIPCLMFTCVMTLVNTDSWQNAFFWITIASVVVINVLVAIFQGGLSGVAAKFPPRYMGAVVQGQGLGGIFASAVNVITLAMPGFDFETAAFSCFLVTVLFLLIAVLALMALIRTEFFMVGQREFFQAQIPHFLFLQFYYESRHCSPLTIDGETPSLGPAGEVVAERHSLIPEGPGDGSKGDSTPKKDSTSRGKISFL